MKTFLTIIGLVAAFALSASAQAFPKYGNQTISVPTSLTAGTTNYPLASAPYIDTSSQDKVAFSSTIWGTATIGATNLYYFAPTLDGTYYDTNSTHLILATNTVSAASTTNTCIQTWNANGVRGYKLITIVTTGTVTNGTHQYGVKIQAP